MECKTEGSTASLFTAAQHFWTLKPRFLCMREQICDPKDKWPICTLQAGLLEGWCVNVDSHFTIPSGANCFFFFFLLVQLVRIAAAHHLFMFFTTCENHGAVGLVKDLFQKSTHFLLLLTVDTDPTAIQTGCAGRGRQGCVGTATAIGTDATGGVAIDLVQRIL